MAEKAQTSGFSINNAIGAEQQSAAQQRRADEIERLRQTIVKLESENARLTAKYQNELDMRTAELLELQEAYNLFEQESDQLLNELDQQNERLRVEVRHQNKRSML